MSLSKAFFHTDTYKFMTSKGNVKGHALFYVLFLFLIIRGFCMQSIRKMKSQIQLHSYLLKEALHSYLLNANVVGFLDIHIHAILIDKTLLLGCYSQSESAYCEGAGYLISRAAWVFMFELFILLRRYECNWSYDLILIIFCIQNHLMIWNKNKT